MKKILLLAAFLAVLLAIPSCEGVLTSNDANKSLQFPIYTCVGGITAKIVQGADLATKSENASYYTITAPDFPNAEPLIVEIIEISAGLTFRYKSQRLPGQGRGLYGVHKARVS